METQKTNKKNLEYFPIMHIGVFALQGDPYKPNLSYYDSNQSENINSKGLLNHLYQLKNSNPSVEKSNYGGYQSDSNLYEDPKLTPLNNYIIENIKSLLKVTNPIMTGMWFNSSEYGNSNGLHNHSLDIRDISGVYYLKTPKNCGDITFYNSFDLNYPSHYTPRENTLLLFPSFLYHTVGTNLSNEDRVSIAFNIAVASPNIDD